MRRVAQLQERRDRRLAVVDERLVQRDQVVVRAPARGPAPARAPVRAGRRRAAQRRRRPSSTRSASARVRSRAAQQHGEVVEDVGGLLGDALIGLLAGGAHHLLGLLLDLVAGQRRVVEQGRPCRSRRGAARRALGDRALERRQHLGGRLGLELAAVKAGALAGVAGRARPARPARAARRRRSRSGSPAPPWVLPEVAPLCQSSWRVRLKKWVSPVSRVSAQRLGVHVGEGEHLAGAPVLHDARDEPALVEGHLGVVHRPEF